MDIFKIKKSNKSKRKVYMASFAVFLLLIFTNTILATSYIYNIQNNSKTTNTNDIIKESSISTIATPEFVFQSASQVLMEPTTGKIIYANNENEHLLPASVTKIMTMLLIMEQIDSR